MPLVRLTLMKKVYDTLVKVQRSCLTLHWTRTFTPIGIFKYNSWYGQLYMDGWYIIPLGFLVRCQRIPCASRWNTEKVAGGQALERLWPILTEANTQYSTTGKMTPIGLWSILLTWRNLISLSVSTKNVSSTYTSNATSVKCRNGQTIWLITHFAHSMSTSK